MLKAKASEDLVHSSEPCCSGSKQEFKDVTINYSSMDIQHLLIHLIYPLPNHLEQQQSKKNKKKKIKRQLIIAILTDFKRHTVI